MQEKATSKSAINAFAWEDPFLLDDQLTEEERAIRDTAREYCQSKLLPRVVQSYLDEKTDRAIFNEMGELGLLGVTIAPGSEPWSGSVRPKQPIHSPEASFGR